MSVYEPDDEGRRHMLRLLDRLAVECAASTSSRPWTAKVGLADGALVELGRVDLASLPTIVLEDRRKHVIYTTLRDIVHLEVKGTGAPRLEHALQGDVPEALNVD